MNQIQQRGQNQVTWQANMNVRNYRTNRIQMRKYKRMFQAQQEETIYETTKHINTQLENETSQTDDI